MKNDWDLTTAEQAESGFIGQEARDRTSLSEKAWYRLRSSMNKLSNTNLPSLWSVNQAKATMDKFYKVNKNDHG